MKKEQIIEILFEYVNHNIHNIQRIYPDKILEDNTANREFYYENSTEFDLALDELEFKGFIRKTTGKNIVIVESVFIDATLAYQTYNKYLRASGYKTGMANFKSQLKSPKTIIAILLVIFSAIFATWIKNKFF